MRTGALAALVLAPLLAVPAALEAAGTGPPVRQVEIAAPAGAAASRAGPPASLGARLAELGAAPEGVGIGPAVPTDGLVLGWFEVDTTSAVGQTFLWAVRNESEVEIELEAVYLDLLLAELGVEHYELAPRQVATRNLRDVPELVPDADGFARGLVVFLATDSVGNGPGIVTGDVFRVEPGEDFASGGLLPSLGVDGDLDLCECWQTRYFAGGPFSGGTRIAFLADAPQGPSCATDPPTVFGRVYDEAGAFLGDFEICAGIHAFEVPVELLLPPGAPPFGALEIEFSLTVGRVAVEHRAAGRYSVGLDGTCTDPPPG